MKYVSEPVAWPSWRASAQAVTDLVSSKQTVAEVSSLLRRLLCMVLLLSFSLLSLLKAGGSCSLVGGPVSLHLRKLSSRRTQLPLRLRVTA